ITADFRGRARRSVLRLREPSSLAAAAARAAAAPIPSIPIPLRAGLAGRLALDGGDHYPFRDDRLRSPHGIHLRRQRQIDYRRRRSLLQAQYALFDATDHLVVL